jgi:hypothetical protein
VIFSALSVLNRKQIKQVELIGLGLSTIEIAIIMDTTVFAVSKMRARIRLALKQTGKLVWNLEDLADLGAALMQIRTGHRLEPPIIGAFEYCKKEEWWKRLSNVYVGLTKREVSKMSRAACARKRTVSGVSEEDTRRSILHSDAQVNEADLLASRTASEVRCPDSNYQAQESAASEAIDGIHRSTDVIKEEQK